jgi:hypothetical protein
MNVMKVESGPNSEVYSMSSHDKDSTKQVQMHLPFASGSVKSEIEVSDV